jgi:competence protein ComEC
MIDINDGRRLRAYEREELLRRPGGYFLALLEESQLPDPIGWFKSRFGNYLFRFILSHPDADHLSGLRRLLAGELTLENFWDLPHSRAAPSGSTADARDWHAYQRYRRGGMISVTKRLSPLAGARGMSWSDDGIEILAPTHLDSLLDGILGRYNDMSYVVRIWHAGRSILIPGDIEEPGWRRLVERSGDLRADVLVASHHGRRSGYFEAAVDAISPTFVVVSTGPLAAPEDAHRLYRARVLPGNFYSTRSQERSAFASTTRVGSR